MPFDNTDNLVKLRTELNRRLEHQELDENFLFAYIWRSDRTFREHMHVVWDLGNGPEWFICKVPSSTLGSFLFPAEWNRIGAPALPPGGSSTIGLPTDGVYGTGTGPQADLSGIQPGDSVEDALDKHESILEKLAPAHAPLLATLSLELGSPFTGAELTTGTVRNTITTTDQPAAVVNGTFRDGATGTLTADVDGGTAVTVNLQQGTDQSGLYTNSEVELTLTEVPFPLSPATPFYEALQASLQAATPLTAGSAAHTYNLDHDGSSTSLSFYVDTPVGPPTFSGVAFTGDWVGTPRYVSGVPCLGAGDRLLGSFVLEDAVSYFYHPTRVARLQTAVTAALDLAAPAIPTTYNADLTFTNQPATILTGVTAATVATTLTGYTYLGTTGTDLDNFPIRVDSLSNEALRRKSGQGQFPVWGVGAGQAGDTFVSTTSLATAGNEELQLDLGTYRYPTADFSTIIVDGVPGPNYSAVPAGSFNNVRWVLLALGALPGPRNAVTVTLQGLTGVTTAPTANFYVQARVVGVSGTGWLDANAPYSLSVGDPANDGDPALDLGASTASVRRVTFGTTVREGDLYVRVGIPQGSTITLTGVTLTSTS